MRHHFAAGDFQIDSVVALEPQEREALRIPDQPKPWDWCLKNIRLSTGYTNPGPLRAYQWQREPVNAITKWCNIILLGPTQSGKSTIADLLMYYSIGVYRLPGMIAYGNEKIVRRVFKTRIRDMITHNSVLKKFWSGKDDDLAIEGLQLSSGAWRIASAQNRNDLATFSAAVCIGSEVSKWETVSFSPVKELIGRQGAYLESGKWRLILESTPDEIGDQLYQRVYKPNVLILAPHVKCPHCGTWQVWADDRIKLRRDLAQEIVAGQRDTKTIRKLKDKSCHYSCAECEKEITETDRARMNQKVVWAAPDVSERVTERYTFTQEAEHIEVDGTVPAAEKRRENYDTVCFWWNRLISSGYRFYQCLADFFDATNSPEDLHAYMNNTMARFYRRELTMVATAHLEAKREASSYYQRGDDAFVPAPVLVITFGVDTQKAGFYYTANGWGANMEHWLLRHGFIDLPDDAEEYQDYRKATTTFVNRMFGEPFRRKDGKVVQVSGGFIDRGGHRQDLVDAICNMSTVRLLPYIGAAKWTKQRRELVWESSTGDFWLGKTEQLSEKVGTMMRLKTWHIPHDTEHGFMAQAVRQYHYNETDRRGNLKRVWKHGGDDHYRDCLNMSLGVMYAIGMDVGLFDLNTCEQLRWHISDGEKPKEEQAQAKQIQRGRRAVGSGGSSYFSGGRW